MDNHLSVNQQILEMTTIVNCQSSKYRYTSQGSGFFYSELAKEPSGPINEEKQLGWYQVLGTWLVTNRHVVFPQIVAPVKGQKIETVPDSFTFNFKEVIGDEVKWIPVTLSQNDLLKRTLLHADDTVDVVAIKVDDLATNLILSKAHPNMMSSCKVTDRDLPSSSPLTIEATSDVVICSYPHGFYDTVNKYPIVKSGIIASSWGKPFNGTRTFLVDANLFPGSSGGLVLSKPTDIARINGKVMHSDYKHYVFLGVYSGQYNYVGKNPDGTTKVESYGLGIVWYSDLVHEIVNSSRLRVNADEIPLL